MSVSLNSQADRMTSTISLGSVTAWTTTCWVKMASNLGRAACPWMVHDGTGAGALRLNFYNGVEPTFQTTGNVWFQLFGFGSATIGTWYFIGISAQMSGTVRVAYRSDGSDVWGGSDFSLDPVTVTANTLVIGGSHFSDQYIDGSMCCVKMYQGALTRDEMMNESWSGRPRRTEGLRVWYPLLTLETADYSGSGNTLSTGTATVDTGIGPALPWGPGRRRIVIPASSEAAEKSLADAGSGADALAASVAAALADSGTAADALSVAVGSALADSGSATDGLSVSASVALADAASATDQVTTGTPKSVADSGAATDAMSASAAVSLADTASASETLAASVAVVLADSGAASDAMTSGELLVKAFADSGVASDALSVEVFRQIVGAGSPYTAWSAGAPETRWVAGAPYSPWAASSPSIGWAAGPPSTRYSAGPPVLEEV